MKHQIVSTLLRLNIRHGIPKLYQFTIFSITEIKFRHLSSLRLNLAAFCLLDVSRGFSLMSVWQDSCGLTFSPYIIDCISVNVFQVIELKQTSR